MFTRRYYYPPVHLKQLPEPKNELKNEYGKIFYQYAPFELNENHMKKLDELGVEINNSLKFTPEEDEILLENWTKIQEEHLLKVSHSLCFIGYRRPWICVQSFQYRLEKTSKLEIWPKLCENLENRTAWIIQRRLSLLLDENYVVGNDEATEEQIELTRKIDVNISRTELKKFYDQSKIPLYFIANIEKLDNSGKNCSNIKSRNFALFKTVLRAAKISEIEFATILSKRSSRKIHKKVKINWEEVLTKTRTKTSEENMEEDWNLLAEKLIEVYEENLMENEKKGEYSELTWFMCKKIVFASRSSLNDRLIFIRCLHKCVDIQATSMTQYKFVNTKKLREKLKSFGFSSLCQSSKLSTWKIYQQLATRLKSLDDEIFELLEPKPCLKEKLMIFFESIIRQKSVRGITSDIYNTTYISNNIIFKVVEEYYKIRYSATWNPEVFGRTLDISVNENQEDELEEQIIRKRRKIEESPIMKRLKIRILSEEEKKNIQISPIISNLEELDESRQSSTYDSTDETTFLDLSEIDTTVNTTASLRPDETVIARGGNGVENLADSFFETSTQDEYSSRIIEIPKIVEVQPIKSPVIVPKNAANNWLDLLG